MLIIILITKKSASIPICPPQPGFCVTGNIVCARGTEGTKEKTACRGSQPAAAATASDVAWVQHTTPGLHISANRSRANPHSHSNASAAGLRLIVALQGPLQLRFDQQDFRLQPQRQAQVLLVNLNEQALFQRHCGQPGVEQKVCMALEHDWLERHGLAEAGGHGVRWPGWRASIWPPGNGPPARN